MIYALVLALAAPTPKQIIDASIAAFKARKSFAVSIKMDSNYQGSVESHAYELAFQYPNRVKMARLTAGHQDLIFWLDSKNFIGYDPASNEKVVRPAPTRGPIVNRLANMMGGLQDVVSAQLSPTSMEAFLSPFRELPGWKVFRTGDKLSLVRSGKVPAGAVKTRFDFSASSHLLTEALLQGPISKLVWSYRYRPAPRSLAFAPPRSAKLVRTLFEHVDVKNADPAAKKVLDQALKAYSNLKQVAFTVDGPEKKVAIWINGNSFRERQPKLDWVYSGGVLTIQTFWNGKVYRGSCKQNAISSYLRILGQPMEPMLQALIVQRNPLDAWLHPSLRIRSKGRVKIGSLVCDAVELDSNFLEISLLVRQDNHLISTVTSRTLGEKKELLAENTRTFKYSSVQKQLPASTFRLPAKNYLPLSAIK